MVQDVPKILKEFEDLLIKCKENYKIKDKTSISIHSNSEARKKAQILTRNSFDLLFRKGAEVALLMEIEININCANSFRRVLSAVHEYVPSSDYSISVSFAGRILDLEQIYWMSKPALILKYEQDKHNKITLKLEENIDLDAKDYLGEAERSLNANAPKASVVMTGAALEKILRKIHLEQFGKSDGIKLWQIMDNLEKKGILKKEDEKMILQLCKLFRNFAAHPSDLVVSIDLAQIILKSAEAFINSEVKLK